MEAFDAIAGRRSIKRFAPRVIGREEIERLLEAAVLAPNHRMTEPWGFLVLGSEAKRAYAEVRARHKAENAADASARAAVRTKVVDETMAVPVIVAVTSYLAEDPLVREEDFAATYMAIENLLIAATSCGLGTHLRTGKLLDHAELRAALDIGRRERLVAAVYLGESVEVPVAKRRAPAAQKTRWLL